MMRTLPMLSALSLLAFAASATLKPARSVFVPSKNIACQYFDYDKQNVLRCDIRAVETTRRPADCDLDWGKAFEMKAKGHAYACATATR